MEDGLPTTESEMIEFLMASVEEATVDEDDGVSLPVTMRSFADVGLLTDNEGILFRFPNGAEYQVTIVQSREAR